MTLRLTNSLTNRVEEFRSIEPGVVKFYACGPTVYDYAHIGNFRTFLLEDLLRRALEARGWRVRMVMNITDVGHMTVDDLRDAGEDKMALAARRFEGDPYRAAAFYEEAFRRDLSALNFRPMEAHPRATEWIGPMIAHVKRLVTAGHAYVVGGNVYYDVSTFPGYGKLSGNTVEALQAGARLEVNPEKRHPADFALWKADPKHLMKWDSPWGEGYPGWHIECSAMAAGTLGEEIDVHAGGEDNRFPHHECEIAQTEALTGRPFARYWVHSAHLLVDGGKMSKSKGTFYTLSDLVERGWDPMEVRLALYAAHYRQPQNFTMETLADARKNLGRVRDLVRRLGPAAGAPDRPEVARAAAAARAEFDAALDDDLNTPRARAALLSLVADVNRAGPPLSPRDADLVREALTAMDAVLGVKLLEAGADAPVLDDEIRERIREREAARARKDFAAADRIRDELKSRGIVLVDTPDGPSFRRE